MNQAEKKAKKLLFLITKATWGGAQKYVFDLATHVTQGEFASALAYGERGRLSAALEERGVPTHRIAGLGRDISILSDIASFFQTLTLLRRERPDVVHLNSSKAATLGALAARACGTRRIITTIHGWPFKEDRSTLVRAFIYLASYLTCLLSHAVIVVSERDLEIGRRMLGVKKKIVFIQLGIAAPDFSSREDAWRQVQEIASIENPALPRVVTVAELTNNKGIRYGIDAIAALRDRNIACNYFIVGDGKLREALEEYAIEKEVETRVVFLGYVENASRLLKAFDVFLLPSIKEGMPYVLLEAAQARLPIVASNVIDPSFAGPTVALVPPRAAMFAEALERALQRAAQPLDPRYSFPLQTMIERTVSLY